MMWRQEHVRRYTPVFLAVVLAGLLLTGLNSTTSAVTPASLSPFVPANTLNKPVGVAATPGRLLVTDCSTNGSPEVLSIDSSGNVIRPAFATLPGTCGGAVENYVTIAPGPTNPQGVQGFPTPNPAGFTSNFAFATGQTNSQVPAIFEIGLDGSVYQFATFPNASCPALSGITFDRVGSFQNRLIAVCSGGQVWLIGPVTTTPTGLVNTVSCPSTVCQLIATVPTSGGAVSEGPDVALSTAPLPGLAGGPLLVAVGSAGGGGKVFAVSPPPSSTVQQVTTTSSPESVAFIPPTKCPYAPAAAPLGSAPVYFTADYGNNTIDFLSPNAFAVFGGHAAGNALITTEANNGITLLSSANGKLVTSTFAASRSTLQGSAFVDCTTPLLLQTFRNDFTINPGASGVVSVRILKTSNFNPLNVCVGHGVTAGGQTCPSTADPSGSPPTYGVTGTEASFAGCGSNLVSTAQGPALECKFTKNLLGIQTPNYTGRLIIKLFYVGGGGDGDAEGGD